MPAPTPGSLETLPDEDLLNGGVPVVDAGGVHVIYGTALGLSEIGDQFWHQNSAGIKDEVEANDRFGTSLLGSQVS